MVSANFLGLAGDKAIERTLPDPNPKLHPWIQEACAATINKYGVGSCGPRGFYGTIDVHLHLEEHLAKFMQTQETIIYAYDLATVPSILPAFANAKDIIICDEAACFAIQNGAVLSRAQVKYFRHNDVADLERILAEQAAKDKRSKLRLNRRFIVVEGISQNLGDIAPLDQIFKLKEKFKYRLVLDESLSFGVLGATGRGAAEHFGLMPGQVEIVAASMGNSLASIGGFCAGDRDIVDHQRLSGLGYCFSASLPPYLATGAICALQRMQEQPELVLRVAQNARRMRELLHHIAGLSVHGGPNDDVSPLIHVQLEQPLETIWQGKALLQQVVNDAYQKEGVLFTVHRLSDLDKAYSKTPASICVAVTAQHSQADMQKAADALQKACSRCFSAK
ncbi:MAG: serine palmitoyltransferase 1, partial [Trebouxia sp. A1-2]